jgi:hypothetical protein
MHFKLTIDRRDWRTLKKYLDGRGVAWIGFHVPPSGNWVAHPTVVVIGAGGRKVWRGAEDITAAGAAALAELFARYRRPEEIEQSRSWASALAAVQNRKVG